MSLTAELLDRLRADALPSEPPDGYASARQISEAMGVTKKAVSEKMKAAGILWIDVRQRDCAHPVRYYDLASFMAKEGKR